MKEQVTETRQSHEDEIDLRSLLALMWRGRVWLAAFVLAFGALAVVHAFISVPVYRSEALVAVRADDLAGSLGMIRNQLGGLASLAGLGTGASSSRRQEFVAYLKSRALAKEFVEKRQLMQLFYASLWNPDTNSFQAGSRGRPPTIADATDLVLGLRQVSEQPRTGLVIVSFEWTDPDLTARWANDYVGLANEKLREEAIGDAQQSIAYLTQELARTTLEPVRQSLYGIMEGRLNQAMLASVEHEYAFKPIDRAEPSERDNFVRPKRVIEIVIGIVFGLILGMAFVFWRYSRDRFVAR